MKPLMLLGKMRITTPQKTQTMPPAEKYPFRRGPVHETSYKYEELVVRNEQNSYCRDPKKNQF